MLLLSAPISAAPLTKNTAASTARTMVRKSSLFSSSPLWQMTSTLLHRLGRLLHHSDRQGQDLDDIEVELFH